ncbi:phenylacetate-CoA ligase [Rhodopseudomonas rhenobacensis]|uniref:Phenylacetate-CoA ligase n=1 Tax=Rhodopseudomonas rhenobacensis TaxID=87461 RepID=A0A7W7Z2L5_9BRAD|nr:phenylacetate-CoA ligase [Rhodopseudomonas rhenobacensis]
MTVLHDAATIDSRDPAEYQAALGVYRFERLKQQIRHVWSNADYFRPRLIAAGLSSPDDVRSLDDFRRLPAMLDKASHRQSQEDSLARYGHPFGLHLTVPVEQAVHLAATSGTTGQPTFYVFSRRDLEISHRVLARLFAHAGIRPGETTFHAFGLSLWLAGITYVQALEAYGARPVALGAEAGVPKILRYIAFTRPTTLFATPSMVTQLVERAPKEIGKPVAALGIKRVLCAGEPGAGLPAFRQRVREEFGAEVFDFMGGAWHNAASSCASSDYHGMHYLSDDTCFRYDLVDPATKQPLALTDGAVGEAIHTALDYQAAPAFRYATGDILKIHVGVCPGCGVFGTRMEVVGRVDDMLAIKGVKVYPAAIQNVVLQFQPRVSGELRIRLDRPPPKVEPPLRLVIEAASDVPEAAWPSLADDIAHRIRELLSFRPVVSILPHGSLPRSGQKTKLIEIAGQTAAT